MLIYNKLKRTLEQKGLEEIKAMGEPFNTDEHEALTQIPAPDESQKDKVIDVVQKGYKLNGKVIRYARVVVGC
jgi:molecular chaperone GrpE